MTAVTVAPGTPAARLAELGAEAGRRASSWSASSYLVTPGASFLRDLSAAEADALLSAPARYVLTAAKRAGIKHLVDRPRMVQGPRHAKVIEALGAECVQLRPRWQDGSPIRHPEIPDERRRDAEGRLLIGWASRTHFLEVIVPLTLDLNPDALRGRVSRETFDRWIEIETRNTHPGDGRDAVNLRAAVRAQLGVHTATVKRCRQIARELGLMVDVFTGTMLPLELRREAYQAGSKQRGWANVSCFCVPFHVAQHLRRQDDAVRAVRAVRYARRRIGEFIKPLTPAPSTNPALTGHNTGPVSTTNTPDCACRLGNCAPSQEAHVCTCSCCKPMPSKAAPRRSKDGAARRRAPRRERAGLDLAAKVQKRVPWLQKTAPGRLAGQFARFQTAERSWTAQQILGAMDAINIRLGYSSPARTNRPPYGLLAWYLSQIDPVADHPDHHGRSFRT